MKTAAIAFAVLLTFGLGLAQATSARGEAQAVESEAHGSPQAPKAGAGGKDDMDAIGSRNIGGRGLGNWYSLDSEMRMGREYSQMIDSSVKLVQDPVVTEYVNRIGQNIVRNSDARVPFTIKVIDSGEINAFSLPGGYLYVHSGLLLAAEEEAELAAVMAHEVAHVAARHATRQITRANFANLASIPLIFVGGGVGYAVRSAVGIGLPMSFLKFSRGFEEEADYLGLQYMYKAGYDPQSFMTFFEKVQAKEKQKPGTLSKIFASHPPIASRIARTQKQIETKIPARPEYVITRSEFDDVRERLARLENRRQARDEPKDNRPTLRRAPRTAGDPAGDDDRPTLKRRDQGAD